MELKFMAISENERFARMCAAAFAAQLDPTLEQIADIKTAVSEAVTNSIVHGYGQQGGTVTLRGRIEAGEVTFEIRDTGVGIEDVEQAQQPFFTTDSSGERSGMGFTVMSAFMDECSVQSQKNCGTTVLLKKRLKP